MRRAVLIAAATFAMFGLTQVAVAGGHQVIIGTAGDDKLYGGNGPDEIHGLRGDDLVKGGKGPDQVYGGRGNDVVWTGKGGSGNGDAGYGGPGNDRVYNFGSGQTAGTTDGGPGWDRCIVDQRDVDQGTVSNCEVIIIR